ncbi:MAG: thymidine phosphorylase [Kiritimatiellia bacterium]
MIPQWFIEEKRDGKEHSEDDLRAWVHAVTDESLPDYQLSAWLMAVYLKGMTASETALLTDAMVRSGECVTFNLTRPTADKHSTGGIGDKISIPLAPLAASLGVCVPMISGRGLGITGGTLDKLESISGFNTHLDIPTFKRLTDEIGCCMIGQTDTLAPADRRMYALRDVTGTIPNIPLITASIMSKKLAEGAQTLLFDVKFGSGAFMKTVEEARCLAQSLLATGKRLNRTCIALITDMNQPLGRTIGNALEIRESIEILRGAGPEDVRELTVLEAAQMAFRAGIFPTLEDAKVAAVQKLDDGTAWKKFCEMVAAQGGDLSVHLPKATFSSPLLASRDGFVANVDAGAMGRVALQLGAGRIAVMDRLDLGAGISDLRQQGEFVRKGEKLCVLHGSDKAVLAKQAVSAEAAFTLADKPSSKRVLLVETLQ